MTDPRPETTRLFLAVPLPPDVVETVQDIRRQLETELRADHTTARIPVRWVPATQYHLTLGFHAAFPDAQIPDLKSELIRIAAQNAPIALSLAGPQAIPDHRKPPRILCLQVTTGHEHLATLRRQAHTRVPALNPDPGDQSSTRAFRPHLTLGRLKSAPSRKAAQYLRDIASSIASAAPLLSLSWSAPSLLLIQSTLTPLGPEYTTLQSTPFPSL